MLGFTNDKSKFNYRIVGVALRNGKVLLHKLEGDDFWSLPGGQVEFFETSVDTIKREMEEELGVEIVIQRLAWVAESFFEHQGKSFHEMGFYYLIILPENAEICKAEGPFRGRETDKDLIFQWFEVEKLEEATVYPSFLKTKLKAIPEGIEHIVDK